MTVGPNIRFAARLLGGCRLAQPKVLRRPSAPRDFSIVALLAYMWRTQVDGQRPVVADIVDLVGG